MKTIENLEWRYATKQFNPSKKVSDSELKQLMRAIQLSVSSYGLQLYKVLIIENKALKEKLRSASWGQSQVSDASHLFVFCNYTKVCPSDIDEYIKNSAITRDVPIEKLEGYRNSMKEAIASKSEIELRSWLQKQPYLALGNLLMACAELKIDACPMEGFISDRFNEILELNNQGLNACVIAPVGYRSEEDRTQFYKKIRKDESSLFELL